MTACCWRWRADRVIIVFKGDRFFSHPNQQGRADHWDMGVQWWPT